MHKDQYQPAEYYSQRLDHFNARIQARKRILKQLALLRFGVFILTLVMAVVATRWGYLAFSMVLAFGISAFIILLTRYISLQKELRKDENLAAINSNELQALAGNYSMFENGSEFDDPEHPFAGDLDIFETRGLFQFLNRSASHSGKERLAMWLMQPVLSVEMLRDRQEAVGELAGKPGFRQEFLATGYQEKELPTDKEDLLEWVNEKPVFSTSWFRFLLVSIPVITFTILALVIFSVISPAWILLYLAVPFGITGRYLGTINRKYSRLSRKSDLVKKYSGLLQIVEKESFTAEALVSLKNKLESQEGMPSRATRKLSVILDAFEARNNMIMGFLLNFLFLWDIRQVRRTEQWQAGHCNDLPRWLEVIAEMDALCSLANFRFNHPGSIFPEIQESRELLAAQDLGHPLVPAANRVDNPAGVKGWKHFTIVTGANMAGKSTYLRTIGVGLVMAMAGSAVIAGRMSFRPVNLVTSIRTRDSLQKNESYFYAELKRLKYIIERLEAREQLFILLDEILKGTNSRDKQSGSVALLEKLMRYDAAGLIATHDLALGELEQKYPENISNKSFEVVIENDLLAFDYKLKEGIARQMNATFLMRKMGITD